MCYWCTVAEADGESIRGNNTDKPQQVTRKVTPALTMLSNCKCLCAWRTPALPALCYWSQTVIKILSGGRRKKVWRVIKESES